MREEYNTAMHIPFFSLKIQIQMLKQIQIQIQIKIQIQIQSITASTAAFLSVLVALYLPLNFVSLEFFTESKHLKGLRCPESVTFLDEFKEFCRFHVYRHFPTIPLFWPQTDLTQWHHRFPMS